MNQNGSSNGNAEAPEADPAIAHARELLTPFLGLHPESSVEMMETQAGPRLAVRRPWNEDALVIFLPEDAGPLSDALNNVHLPERYTAIWHRDSRDLEVIWTAYPLGFRFDDIRTRSFQFTFGSVEHVCAFERSSDRLLLIAEHSSPVRMSHTNHRNLSSFSLYAQRTLSDSETNGSDRSSIPLGDPFSFWIRNVEWDENRILRLIRHLNFYLTYYDSRSPHIFIHAAPSETSTQETRYRFDNFPTRIDSHDIEDDLLQLWTASLTEDPGRKFVYCYRIIEYAAHAYIDRAARREVRRALLAPHALSDMPRLTEQVIGAALSTRMDDPQRMVSLLRDVVDPELLWREVDQNQGAFTAAVQFDGGFELGPLIGVGETLETFKANGLQNFATASRNIRNHLSHGRDRATQTSIMPTVRNLNRLEPWAAAISMVAGEVINFKYLAIGD